MPHPMLSTNYNLTAIGTASGRKSGANVFFVVVVVVVVTMPRAKLKIQPSDEFL